MSLWRDGFTHFICSSPSVFDRRYHVPLTSDLCTLPPLLAFVQQSIETTHYKTAIQNKSHNNYTNIDKMGSSDPTSMEIKKRERKRMNGLTAAILEIKCEEVFRNKWLRISYLITDIK